jgi:beta-glucanase (GH16 family)
MGIDPNNPTATAKLTFDDEFNGLSLWNGTSGTWATTFWYDSTTGNGDTLAGNGEQEWYINANDPATASVVPWKVDSSGVLHITAAPASSTISPLINNYQYTSGELNTYHSFSQTYGLFEVRAKLPTGQGFWPAFWLMPENGSWPPELDVMEALGNNASTIYTTAHSTTLAGNQESQAVSVANTSAWHTYAVDWEPDYITWYVDGQAVYKVATPADMNSPMYMILNLAVGGSWPGNANSTTNFANDMEVDWVKVYQSSATLAATPAAAVVAAPPVRHASPLIAAASATLTAATSFTSGALLANGVVVVAGAADNGWGSHVGTAGLYNAGSGAQTKAVALSGYTPIGATMSPQVTVLNGGFWEVTYAGAGAPQGYEFYNSAGQLAFIENKYTAAGEAFTTLDTGGWLLTDAAWGRFAVTQANGTVNWVAEPVVGGVASAPGQVQALSGGGFVFTYAGSTQLDVYGATGAHLAAAHLGAANSGFAMATSEMAGGGFAAAWLSPPAGGGFNEQLDIQTFSASGVATTAAVSLAIDADPWHTQIQILKTAVPADAVVLWSQGGAVWGAVVEGATASTPKALGTGTLAAYSATALSDGSVALTWVQTDNGVSDVWVETLNAAGTSLSTHLLGAGTGGAHLVATANGGFAVSWHNGATIEGVVNHGADGYGDVTSVGGDFLGLDASGQVIALGHNASGGAVVLHYGLGVDPVTGV